MGDLVAELEGAEKQFGSGSLFDEAVLLVCCFPLCRIFGVEEQGVDLVGGDALVVFDPSQIEKHLDVMFLLMSAVGIPPFAGLLFDKEPFIVM